MSILSEDIIIKGKDGLYWTSCKCFLGGRAKRKWFRNPSKSQHKVSLNIIHEIIEQPIENLIDPRTWTEIIGHHINIEKHLRIVLSQNAPDEFIVWAGSNTKQHEIHEILDLEFQANSDIGQQIIDNLFKLTHRHFINT